MVILIENPICFLLEKCGFEFVEGVFLIEKYCLEEIQNYQIKTIENTGWRFTKRTYDLNGEVKNFFTEAIQGTDSEMESELKYILKEFNLF